METTEQLISEVESWKQAFFTASKQLTISEEKLQSVCEHPETTPISKFSECLKCKVCGKILA